jgi:hypothetical protein
MTTDIRHQPGDGDGFRAHVVTHAKQIDNS